MPQGYLVTLGTNNSLDSIDAISGALIDFDNASTLIGTGEWIWSGTFGGTTYVNEAEPGSFYVTPTGEVYFVPDLGPVTTLTEGSVLTAPTPQFTLDDGIVEGGDTADLIDTAYTDPDGSQVGTGADSVTAGDGADTVTTGAGNDTVFGNGGADSISAGDGADLIYGDNNGTPAATSETLVWDDVVADEASVEDGFVTSTGNIDVAVSFTNDGNNNPLYSIESTDAVYVGPGETFGTNSSLYLFGQGDGATSTTTIAFTADDRGYTGEVDNLVFRINDFDWGSGNHRDILTINAYDADGNPVDVILTVGSNPPLTTNTITAGDVVASPTDLAGSVLVEFGGPVATVEISYANGLTNTQAVWVSDLQFDAIPADPGNDTIDAGAGNDTVFGEGGDDSILGGDGADSISGGDGADTLEGGIGDDTILGDAGADSILGGDGADSIDGGAGIDLVDGGAGNDTIVNVQSGESVLGGDDNDSIVGNAADGAGVSTIDGGAGDDFIDGSDRSDLIYGGTGNDTIEAGEENSIGDDDTIFGGDGNDLITSAETDSRSNDSLYGEAGDDTITVTGGNLNLLSGGDGLDLLQSGSGSDTLDGGAGNDTIEGGGGNDQIIGGLGADSMTGGAGNDTITVAQGDTVQGGDGDDLFILSDLAEAGSGDITITGGEGAETGGDTLDLGVLAAVSDVVITNGDDTAGGLSGYATMADGSIVYFDQIENIICFTPGTMILTEHGERPVETLKAGDRVVTRDEGLQPIRWMGSRMVRGRGDHAPIRIAEGGLFGARRPLLVSPQHRMLIDGYRAELTMGEEEVLVAAKHMIDGTLVRREECAAVTYLHMLLDRHQVVYAEGAATESFHLGDQGLEALTAGAREDLFRTLPHLRADPNVYGPTARRCAKPHEARLLIAA